MFIAIGCSSVEGGGASGADGEGGGGHQWGGGNIAVGGGVGNIWGVNSREGVFIQPLRTALHIITISLHNSLSG